MSYTRITITNHLTFGLAHGKIKWSWREESNSQPADYKSAALPIELHQHENGASERNRTTDTGIFSPLLYQLSYRGNMATRRGLEPLTSAVTGRHSNQLNYRAKMVGANGIEPLTLCL